MAIFGSILVLIFIAAIFMFVISMLSLIINNILDYQDYCNTKRRLEENRKQREQLINSLK